LRLGDLVRICTIAREGIRDCCACGRVFVFARTPAVQSSASPGKPELPTKEAFERYVALTDARNTEEFAPGLAVSMGGRIAGSASRGNLCRDEAGKVMIERVETRDNGTIIECPKD